MQLRLALRERAVLFFNYVFPLIFFFGFGLFMGGRATGAAMTRIVTMVIVLGILGSGLFGAGLRAVAERETGILRRYKVAPITPAPILVASLVTGWLLYLPSAILIVLLSHWLYQMPLPSQPVSLMAMVTLGCFAFRAIGLIVAAVANSAAESNVIVQILYMPMLFLSGATFPISSMPVTAQIVAQFLPASYLNTGMQHVMLRAEGIAANGESVVALVLTTLLGTFLATKLFRWEKEEKVARTAKAWVVAVFLPFLVLGGWQAYSREHIIEAKQLDRQIRRSQARLIRGATIFAGDGRVVVNGAVLIRDGRIEQVFSTAPEASAVNAETLEATGKTVLPGLVDLSVRLEEPGGVAERAGAAMTAAAAERALAAYLYSGVTAIHPAGELSDAGQRAAKTVNTGARLGAEVVQAGGLVLEREWGGEQAMARLREKGGAFVPALAAAEVRDALEGGGFDPFSATLVQQVAPPGLIERTRARLGGAGQRGQGGALAAAREKLLSAYRARAPLAMGTESGVMGLVHGPAIHREMKLWVEAGIPAAEVLAFATARAAGLMGAYPRLGAIQPGAEATLVIVDGNPLADITATERIASVIFKGELVARTELFDQK
jgi:ABC-2 type transport system permease protein